MNTLKSITLLPQPHLKVFVDHRLLATCDRDSRWSFHSSDALIIAAIQLNGNLQIDTDCVELVVA